MNMQTQGQGMGNMYMEYLALIILKNKEDKQ